mmetsp:Transcript_54364/g.86501  ORF Transcript_54364/g.86501 Transcript_54364/m.86501 type:complete len:94 (-) Transcript_54364:153-434(-)
MHLAAGGVRKFFQDSEELPACFADKGCFQFLFTIAAEKCLRSSRALKTQSPRSERSAPQAPAFMITLLSSPGVETPISPPETALVVLTTGCIA